MPSTPAQPPPPPSSNTPTLSTCNELEHKYSYLISTTNTSTIAYLLTLLGHLRNFSHPGSRNTIPNKAMNKIHHYYWIIFGDTILSKEIVSKLYSWFHDDLFYRWRWGVTLDSSLEICYAMLHTCQTGNIPNNFFHIQRRIYTDLLSHLMRTVHCLLEICQ